MKKSEYNNIEKSCNRNKFIMFVQTLEEVLFTILLSLTNYQR